MAGQINEYPNTASTVNTGSFFDIDQKISSSPDVYQSQKVPTALMKELMLSENVEQLTVAAAQAKAAGSTFVSMKTYIITNADGGSKTIKVMARRNVTNLLYATAINMATGEISTYDLTSDVLTKSSGTFTPVLAVDGSVCTSANSPLEYFTKTGDFITCSMYVNVFVDFSAGSAGTIDHTNIFSAGTSIGNISVDAVAISPQLPIMGYEKNGVIYLQCEDTAAVGNIIVYVTYQAFL